MYLLPTPKKLELSGGMLTFSRETNMPKVTKRISKELFITEHTVKKHTSNIFSKLNLKDRIQAALYAYNNGLIGF